MATLQFFPSTGPTSALAAQPIGMSHGPCWDCVHLWELRDLDTQAMCRRSAALHFAPAGCRDFRLGVDDDGCREG